jgi:hypothetical protein
MPWNPKLQMGCCFGTKREVKLPSVAYASYGMVSIKNNIVIMNQMDGSDLNITEDHAMHV